MVVVFGDKMRHVDDAHGFVQAGMMGGFLDILLFQYFQLVTSAPGGAVFKMRSIIRGSTRS